MAVRAVGAAAAGGAGAGAAAALAENVLDAGAPQFGHRTSGVSDIGCSTSNTLPQLEHL